LLDELVINSHHVRALISAGHEDAPLQGR
jgi:hypothetical protein